MKYCQTCKHHYVTHDKVVPDLIQDYCALDKKYTMRIEACERWKFGGTWRRRWLKEEEQKNKANK